MTLYELMDLAQAVGGRIDVQWGFFITIHMALLGGIVYVDRPLRRTEKLVASAFYLIFAGFNYIGLRSQQMILGDLYADIGRLKDAPCCADSAVMTFYAGSYGAEFADRAFYITLLAHVLALIVVLVSIASDKARKR